jgi:type III secretion system YscJ/HrcJ family lipoprotein
MIIKYPIAGFNVRNFKIRSFTLLFSILFAFIATGCNSNKSIVMVKQEDEAIEILDVLRENNIRAEKILTGDGNKASWNIVVKEGWFEKDVIAHANRILRNNGLPRPIDKSVEPAGGSMIQSEADQKAKRLKEQRADIERHLRALPGVIRASVQVVLPEEDTLRMEPYPASASVLLVLKSALSDLSEEKIQRMVAGSVIGLKPEQVTVTLTVQPPRPLPDLQAEAATERHSVVIYAIIAGGITIIATLLIILIRQVRRNRSFARQEMEGSVKTS